MSLKSTRKILSIIFIVIIAAGGSLFAGAVTVKATLCSESYLQRHFTSDRVMAQCQQNFDSRIEALSEKSGIPVRAFEAVSNFEEIKSDSPVRRLFGGHDTTLYTSDTVERFEQLCIEYLEGNSIKYDKELIHNTADEAAKIYADCFGLKNTDEISGFINSVNENYQRFISISSLMLILPIVLLFLLYKKVYDIFLMVFSAFTAEGVTLVFSGAIGLILKLGQSALIYPQIYALAAGNVIRNVFVILMIAGFVITAVFVFFNVYLYKKNSKNNTY